MDGRHQPQANDEIGRYRLHLQRIHDLFMSALLSSLATSGYTSGIDRCSLSQTSHEVSAIMRKTVHVLTGDTRMLLPLADHRFPMVRDLRLSFPGGGYAQPWVVDEALLPSPAPSIAHCLSGLKALTVRGVNFDKQTGQYRWINDPVSSVVMPILAQACITRLHLECAYYNVKIPSPQALILSPSISPSLRCLTVTDYTSVDQLVAGTILPVVRDDNVLSNLCSLKLHAKEHAYVWHADTCIHLLDFFRCLSGRHRLPSLTELILYGALGKQQGGDTSSLHAIASEGLDLSHLSSFIIDDRHALGTIPALLRADSTVGHIIICGSLDGDGNLPEYFPLSHDTLDLLHDLLLTRPFTRQGRLLAVRAWMAVLKWYSAQGLTEAQAMASADIIATYYPLNDHNSLECLLHWLSYKRAGPTAVRSLLLLKNVHRTTGHLLMRASVGLAHHQRIESDKVRVREAAMAFLLRCMDLLDGNKVANTVQPDTTLHQCCLEATGMTPKDLVKSLLDRRTSLSPHTSTTLAKKLVGIISRMGIWTIGEQVEERGHDLCLLIIDSDDLGQLQRVPLLDPLADVLLCQVPKQYKKSTTELANFLLKKAVPRAPTIPGVGGVLWGTNRLFDVVLSPPRWEAWWEFVVSANITHQPGFANLLNAVRERGMGFPPSTSLFSGNVITKALMAIDYVNIYYKGQEHAELCEWLMRNCFGGLRQYLDHVMMGRGSGQTSLQGNHNNNSKRRPTHRRLTLAMMDKILLGVVVLYDGSYIHHEYYQNIITNLQTIDFSVCLIQRLSKNLNNQVYGKSSPWSTKWYKLKSSLSMCLEPKFMTAIKAVTIMATTTQHFVDAMCYKRLVTPPPETLLSILVVTYATAMVDLADYLPEGTIPEEAVMSLDALAELASYCPEKVLLGLLVAAKRRGQSCGMEGSMDFKDAVADVLHALSSPQYNAIPIAMIVSALKLELVPPVVTPRYESFVEDIKKRMLSHGGEIVAMLAAVPNLDYGNEGGAGPS